MSEQKLQREGMISTPSSYERIPSWPYLPWIIFLSSIFLTIALWVVSLNFNAPLEELSAWAKTPNPAKAPWYFIGLQELLAYFDPWIAGVALPGAIMGGLAMVPYVDTAPKEQGSYDWSKRKFQIYFFFFGTFIWFGLIFVGQFLRGPSWDLYWPFIDYNPFGHGWGPLKVVVASTHNLPEYIGEVGAIGLCLVVFAISMVIPAFIFKEHTRKLGLIKYSIVWVHINLTIGMLVKIFCAHAFSIKYFIVTPWFKI